MNIVAKIIDARAKDKTLYTAWNCPLDRTDTPTMPNSQEDNAAALNLFPLGKVLNRYHPNFGLTPTIAPLFNSGQHMNRFFLNFCSSGYRFLRKICTFSESRQKSDTAY
jgi:hypothetical protein